MAEIIMLTMSKEKYINKYLDSIMECLTQSNGLRQYVTSATWVIAIKRHFLFVNPLRISWANDDLEGHKTASPFHHWTVLRLSIYWWQEAPPE